jgi:hypothetical protein
MRGTASIDVTLLPGAQALLELHARELPQRDDLCGAFCGALALGTAGLRAQADGEPLDQDAVALAAGSVVSPAREAGTLPEGEQGRRDYRLAIPTIAHSALSGTTAAGVASAIEQLSGARLTAIPYSGPWTAETLAGLFDLSAGLPHPVTLVANLATRHLWGSRASLALLLGHLLTGEPQGPPPDRDVGHFVCILGCVDGPAGRLYAVADTYPALGNGGVHMQPQERLAAAIDRRDMPAGGVLVVALAQDAVRVREGAAALGLQEGIWDNGTVASGVPA